MATTRYDTADAIRANLTEEAREALDTLQETAAAADLSTDVIDGRTACALSGPEHRSRAAAAARERLSTWRSVSATRLQAAHDNIDRSVRQHPLAAAAIAAAAGAVLVGLVRVARR
jgi:ElaB/YqjD/DUF883 family membrane-anchored ribosome-binding protein